MRFVVIFILVLTLVYAPPQDLADTCYLQYGDDFLQIVPEDVSYLSQSCYYGDVLYFYLSSNTELKWAECGEYPGLTVIDLNGYRLEILDDPLGTFYVIGHGDIYVEEVNLDFQLREDMSYLSPLLCFDYDYYSYDTPSLFNLGDGEHEFRDVEFACSGEDDFDLIHSAGELEVYESTFHSCENINYGVQVNGEANIHINNFNFDEGTSVYISDTGEANIYSNTFSTDEESMSYGIESDGQINVYDNHFENIGVAVQAGDGCWGDITDNQIINTAWGIDAQGYVEIRSNEITSRDLGIKYRNQVEVTQNLITSEMAAIGYNYYDYVEVSENTFVGEISISKGVNFKNNDVTGTVTFNPYSGNISNNIFDIENIDFRVDNLQDLCDIVYTDNEGPIVTPYECADWDTSTCVDQLVYAWDSCEENETICYDGYDNDDNGLIDGDDPACDLMVCDVNGGSIWMEGQCVEYIPEDVSYASQQVFETYFSGNIYEDTLRYIHDTAYFAEDCGDGWTLFSELYEYGLIDHLVCVPLME